MLVCECPMERGMNKASFIVMGARDTGVVADLIETECLIDCKDGQE